MVVGGKGHVKSFQLHSTRRSTKAGAHLLFSKIMNFDLRCKQIPLKFCMMLLQLWMESLLLYTHNRE